MNIKGCKVLSASLLILFVFVLFSPLCYGDEKLTLSLEGKISRTDEKNNTIIPSGCKLKLFQLNGFKSYDTKTDEKGCFKFENVEPSAGYILVASSTYSYTGTVQEEVWVKESEYSDKAVKKTITKSVPMNKDFSWHLKMDLKKPSKYRIELKEENADKLYDDTTEPKYNPVTRQPFKELKEVEPEEIKE